MSSQCGQNYYRVQVTTSSVFYREYKLPSLYSLRYTLAKSIRFLMWLYFMAFLDSVTLDPFGRDRDTLTPHLDYVWTVNKHIQLVSEHSWERKTKVTREEGQKHRRVVIITTIIYFWVPGIMCWTHYLDLLI